VVSGSSSPAEAYPHFLHCGRPCSVGQVHVTSFSISNHEQVISQAVGRKSQLINIRISSRLRKTTPHPKENIHAAKRAYLEGISIHTMIGLENNSTKITRPISDYEHSLLG